MKYDYLTEFYGYKMTYILEYKRYMLNLLVKNFKLFSIINKITHQYRLQQYFLTYPHV